ncbi:hypothetical protein QQS21_010653 [Conoideocrella luteorostrata]|uniref:Mob1/phocein n=1 Tax=Conoideocrella luteorostrata TaxID=1105319 RepID=A0AAJ0CER2_9HYPO|nr:hypothetical protein QQS21_010653 [Conoideocrella luteorostrata]
MEQSVLDANSKRRIHPGTKAEDMAAGPPLVPLSELDSAFQLQEHLAALNYHHTASGTQAITREAALQLAQPPAGVDRSIWLYELCRFIISQTNSIVVGFLFDTPPCSATTCPEMRASEWQFLCAVHDQPKSCCAIDYSCHTLDWAANVVSDQTLYPSRFVVVNDPTNKNNGLKNLVNVFRRLHRIFAHAWFQHRSVFWSVESQTGLYILFKMICDLYDLLPAENYKLPPEAEGLEGSPAEPEAEKLPPAILKPPSQQRQSVVPEDDGLHPGGRTNTRRHIRSSPSTGSAVTTVLEADEEDTDNVSGKMRSLHISGHQEPEVAEVPVIVEHSVMAKASKEASNAESPSDFEPETPTAVQPSKADETVVSADSSDEPDEEPNVVLIQSDNASKAEPGVLSDETSLPVTHKPQDEPKDTVTSETAASEPAAKEDEPPKETKSEDMTGESGQVTDPE